MSMTIICPEPLVHWVNSLFICAGVTEAQGPLMGAAWVNEAGQPYSCADGPWPDDLEAGLLTADLGGPAPADPELARLAREAIEDGRVTITSGTLPETAEAAGLRTGLGDI